MDVESALRESLAANDLRLESASGAHVFSGEAALRNLAASVAARVPARPVPATENPSSADTFAVASQSVPAGDERERLAALLRVSMPPLLTADLDSWYTDLADRLLAAGVHLTGDALDAALTVLDSDARDPNRKADWRYGVRHTLTVIRAALARSER